MKRFLKELPLPVCGVMLGLAALGNLLQAVLGNLCGAAAGNALRTLCGVLASLILLALVLKTVCCFSGVKEAMQNSATASVSGTVPMALMLLSVYWKPVLGGGAKAVWLFAVALHAALIVWFTLKFFRGFRLENVFASYFIVYVGIAVAAVTAPAYGMEKLGAATVWFGLVCLAVVLTRLPGLLRLPFYPSYAAFTFPFVITAIAALQCMACLKKLGAPLPWLKPLVLAETALASILVFYALIRYCADVCKPKTAVK